MNTFNLSLDLDKSYTGEPVRLRQGDKRGTEIRATIYDHGEPFTGSYTARYVQAIAGTGNEYYRADATFAAGVATVTVNEEYAAAVAGSTYGYFQLVSGSTVIASTQSFPVIILPDATAEAEVGERYDSAIEDALAELDEATGRIAQMVQDATAEYLEAHPEITTTVQDNSLDDDKLIQKGGILQREQWLETMLPNIPRKSTSEADVHSVTDSAGGGPLGIEVYGRSTQDGTPTPDAPVPIESVTSNLLDLTACTAKRFIIKTTGNVGTSDGWSATDYIPVIAGQTYTLVGIANSWSGTAGIAFYDAGKVYVSGLDYNVYTFTVPSGASYVRLSLNSESPSGVQLFAGSTSKAYPYVPYNGIGLHVVGRNLFDSPRSGVRTNNGITWTYNADGTITANGTASSSSWSHDASTRIPMELAAGTYTASVPSPLGLVILNSTDGNYIYNGSDSTKTFTLTNATTVNVYARVASGATVTNLTFGIQLEIGSTATPYQPYESVTIPIDLGGRSLRSLPDGTRDEVNVDQYGNVVLVQRVGVATVDGTYSNMSFQPADVMGGGCSRITLRPVLFPNMVGATLNSDNCLCTHATYGPTGASSTPTEGRFTRPANSNGYLTLPASLTTGPEAQAWLTENPVTFYAPLDEPVTIDLGYLDPALLPAPDLTAYVVPSAPSVLRYGFDVAAAIAEIATA